MKHKFMSTYFTAMMLFITVKAWLTFNKIPLINLMDHIWYMGMGCMVFFNIIVKNRHVKKSEEYRTIRNIFLSFLIFNMIISLIQSIFVNYVTAKGVFYELYKIFRNIPIFLYGLYFVEDETLERFIKIYIGISSVASILGIIQHQLGLPFYKLLKFAPSMEDDPNFYLTYLAENRNFGLFSHPNIFGEFVSISIFMIIYSKLKKKPITKGKVTYVVLLLLNFTGLLVSTSRMSLISVVVILILVSLKFGISYVRRYLLYIVSASAPLVVFMIEKILFKLWQYDYYGDNGVEELRIKAWRQSVEIVYKTFGFGSGMGSWGDASAGLSQSKIFVKLFGEQRLLSDSYLSHLLGENGITIVLLMTVVFLLLCLFNKCYYKNKANRFYCLTSISIILFACISLFKGMSISLYENSIFVFMMLGYTTRLIGRKNRDECTG